LGQSEGKNTKIIGAKLSAALNMPGAGMLRHSTHA